MAVDDATGDAPCPCSFKDPPMQLSEQQLRKPTSEVYQARRLANDDKNHVDNFTGDHAHLRTRLDYTYHKVPSKARQLLQDSIIRHVRAQRTDECTACHNNREHPHVLFTAGAMAAGKGHTLREYLKNGQISLPEDFIWVDPDKIARLLPERQQYLDFDKDNAPERLHPEASMLQEILGLIARETRHSLVVDGSLSDGDWFKQLMQAYRKEGYHIEIFFVFADEDVMERRAKEREKETGRQTDKEKIHESATKAPRSVQELAHRKFVDRVRLVDNSSNSDPPHTVYDTKGDSCFEEDSKQVDVLKWVEKAKSRH